MTITPRAAPIDSRFINAAWIGITSERKTTASSSADSATTTAMKSHSLLESTLEKSMKMAVLPPT